MDTALIQELLKQYGIVSAAVATIIAFILSVVVNIGAYYFNQKIQSKNEEHLEELKMGFEKQLAEYKAIQLKETENIQQARWEMKYQACLDALEIVDSFISNWIVKLGDVLPVRQAADTIKARNCYNKLVLACESPEVTEAFLKIMFMTGVAESAAITDNLNALRNNIRKELGFGEGIKLSKEVAWFVRLSGDERNEKS